MKLTVEPKRLTLGDFRVIADEAGQTRYQVKGHRGLRGKQFRLYDTHGTLLARVLRPKPPVAFTHTRYTVYLDEEPATELSEDEVYQWTFSKLDWTALGDHGEATFRIEGHGVPVLRMMGRPTYWGMVYELELFEENRQILAIASGLMLICVFEERRRMDARRKSGVTRAH